MAASAAPGTAAVRSCYATSACLGMGTINTLRVRHPDAEAVMEATFSRMRALEARLSTYRPDSEISQVNRAAGHHPVAVSEDVYRVVQRALDVSVRPGSGFDLTIGPLVSLWRIGSAAAQRPADGNIAAALALVNAHAVDLDPVTRSVFLPAPGMRLDLGGIAKGYIADEMARVLRENGVTSAAIDLGGNVVVLGACHDHADGYWRVGIQAPFEPRGSCLAALRLVDSSAVTSGTYERFADIDGRRYHHLIDPATGFPFDSDLTAVTVVSASSLTADAWSTVAFAAGADLGLSEVNGSAGVEAVFVTSDLRVLASDNLAGVLRTRRAQGP